MAIGVYTTTSTLKWHIFGKDDAKLALVPSALFILWFIRNNKGKTSCCYASVECYSCCAYMANFLTYCIAS